MGIGKSTRFPDRERADSSLKLVGYLVLLAACALAAMLAGLTLLLAVV